MSTHAIYEFKVLPCNINVKRYHLHTQIELVLPLYEYEVDLVEEVDLVNERSMCRVLLVVEHVC